MPSDRLVQKRTNHISRTNLMFILWRHRAYLLSSICGNGSTDLWRMIEYEWVNDSGKGDLVFINQMGIAVVVEVKYFPDKMGGNSSTHGEARGGARASIRYRAQYALSHPGMTVLAAVFTNDPLGFSASLSRFPSAV